jgi:hypothetical protein
VAPSSSPTPTVTSYSQARQRAWRSWITQGRVAGRGACTMSAWYR